MTKSVSMGGAPVGPGAPAGAAAEETPMKADSAQAARNFGVPPLHSRDRIIPLPSLSLEILSINTATERAQQVQKCAAHGHRSRQCVRVFGRIGGHPPPPSPAAPAVALYP